MKKLIIISLALLALLTSCNLDNQGIFAEVIDRTPSDNRKLSVIGLSSDTETLYFSSVNGIEAYDLKTPNRTEKERYKTLDDSENARKISISLMVNDKIIYGVTRATQDIVEYTGFYLCDPATDTKIEVNCDKTVIFNGSFENFVYDAEGNIYEAKLVGDDLTFTLKCSAPGEGLSFYSSIDRIFCFKKGSTFTYYLFDETQGLKEISGLDGAGKIRSVTKDSDGNYVAVFSSSNSKVYRINVSTNTAEKIDVVVGSEISRKFSSFIYGDYLCYAFDGSSSFYTLKLSDHTLSSTTVSKISKVAIVGYYSVDNNGTYRVCTSNNGFFTLKIDSDGKVSIN